MGTDERTDKPADFAVTDGINNVRHLPRACLVGRLAVDMDFHVWISDLGYTMDISTPFDMNCHIINFEYSSACHTIQP